MHEHEPSIPLRLLLLDDCALFRVGLSRLLSAEPEISVAGECGSCVDALTVLKSTAVDVVLLDFQVGAEKADDFISQSLEGGYTGRFLIVALSADAVRSARALHLGASGIFLKSEAPELLVQAVRQVHNDGIWIDRSVIRLLASDIVSQHDHSGPGIREYGLADRERTVLQGIVGGLTNREIGDNLGITESSVKNVVQRLFSKARVRTRGQLVRAALEGSAGLRGLFTDPGADFAPAELTTGAISVR